MTSEYTVTVTAASRLDAIDKAARLAWDDGYRAVERRTARVVSVVPGRSYAVTLRVVPK